MITPFQRSVAAMFFSLDESAGFAVAGGAALIARALVDRSTQDVDLFSGAPPVVPIPDVVRAFTRAAVAEGWLVRQLRLSDSFARLAVEADGEVTVVDLGPRPPADGGRRGRELIRLSWASGWRLPWRRGPSRPRGRRRRPRRSR
ncbi:hypothetical protein [Frankia sp. Cas3]|uniref:hypothetical protein n=1 Tax=Frankia sp. Cas3 TaxID=3073926 RepID=UPI002AD4F6E9|nr:hypothetical protein [Frankia sp. Cas3]